MTSEELVLTKVPSVQVGMVIRREPAPVFEAIVDPDITARIWYTKSSGKMTPGATLRWEWEMYGVGSDVHVDDVEENRRVADSTGGFTFLLASLKALLEHDLVLGLVADAHPEGV